MLEDNIFGVYNFIINYNNFVGVLKVITIRKTDSLCMQIDLYKFLKSNQFVLQTIIDQNNANPTDSKLLDRVSTEKVTSVIINYSETKYLCDYISGTIKWANETGHTMVSVNILNKISASLDIPQLHQFYNIVDSFIKNYFLLESIYNIVHNTDHIITEQSNINKNDKITNYVQKDNVCDPALEDCIQQQQNNRPQDNFEVLFEYCCNTNLRNLVVHYSLNYYQYISEETTHIQIIDNVINVKSPNILPLSLCMDKDYFYDNVISSNSIPLSTISTYAGKLIRKVIFEDFEIYAKHPIYRMIFNLILLVYSIRYLAELYAYTFDTKFESLLGNTDDFQKRIIQYYANKFLQDLKLPPAANEKAYVFDFTITDFSLYDQADIKEDDIITKLSEKESHIIPISHELFVEKVFKQLDNDKVIPDFDFRLSNKKIINLSKLIKPDTQIKQSKFIDPDNEIDVMYNEEIDLVNYLRYIENKDNIITTAFKLINEYSKDVTMVSFVKKFPKEILNLFPVISKDILVPQKLPETLDNTFDFYKIVIDNLPRPETVKFSSVLFIVFQIIIPYYYYFYKKTHFNDSFL